MKNKIKGVLSLMRVSNGPTVITGVLAGSSLTGLSFKTSRSMATAAAVLLLYFAGMVLNDLLDFRWDKKNRTSRPLPAGHVTLFWAWGLFFLFLCSGLTTLWFSGLPSFLFGINLVFFMVVYDLWHKNNPWAPVLMGACRGLVYLIGFFTFSTVANNGLRSMVIFVFVFVSAFTFYAKRETQNSKVPPRIAFLIASLCLFDAVILGIHGFFPLSIFALVCFFVTHFAQKWVKGT